MVLRFQQRHVQEVPYVRALVPADVEVIDVDPVRIELELNERSVLLAAAVDKLEYIFTIVGDASWRAGTPPRP